MGGLFAWSAGSVNGIQGGGGAIVGATIGPGFLGMVGGGAAGTRLDRCGVGVAGAGASWVGDGMWWATVGRCWDETVRW